MGIVDKLKGEDSASAEADAAAQKLGYLVYREKTQGTPGGSEVDALVAEITSLQERTETHTADLPEGATPSGAGETKKAEGSGEAAGTDDGVESEGASSTGRSGQTERAEK